MATSDLANAAERIKPFYRVLGDILTAAQEAVALEQGHSELRAQKAALAVEVDALQKQRDDLLVKLTAEEATTKVALDALKDSVQTAHKNADQHLRDLSLRRQVVQNEVEEAIAAAKAEYAATRERAEQEIAETRETLAMLNGQLSDTRARLTALLNG